MDKIEMNKLLVQISYVDNRIIDEYTVEMWMRIFPPDVTYQEASSAVPIAFAESNEYLTPHRILQIVKRIRNDHAQKRDHEQRLELESSEKTDPIPICRDHDLPIMQCDVCIRRMSDDTGRLTGDRLHQWAIANIYKKEE